MGEAECNPDEVVTGGGYDITMRRGGASPYIFVKNFKELAVNNSWHVEVFEPRIVGRCVYMQMSNLYRRRPNVLLNGIHLL